MTQSNVEDVKLVTSSSVGSVTDTPFQGIATTSAITAGLFQYPTQGGAVIQVSVTKKFEMCCAHYLPYHTGKCKDMHGHNYKIEVTAKGVLHSGSGPESGMVKDFYQVSKDVHELILDRYDHKLLNDFFYNPTAEILAVIWLEELSAINPGYCKVTVWETDDCFATASK